MQRCLGIDYGSRNVGLALSDETGKFAFPYKTIQHKNVSDLMKQLRETIEKEGVNRLVLGLPRSFKREDTAQTREIRQAAKILEQELGLPILFQDELFTSKIAEKHSVKNADASAAALILQSYLDSLRDEKQ